MKGLIVGLIILATLSLDGLTSFALELCAENERVYIPTMEYAKADKRILLVGMSHIGPKEYFARARQTIDRYIGTNSNVTILTEFLTCQASTRDIVPGTKLHGGDHDAEGGVGQEAVVNPVAGESDDKSDILHGPNSVPGEPALGPIGQSGVFRWNGPRYLGGLFEGSG